MIGNQIHAFASRLFPLNRSLTGDGVRETLKVLKGLLPQLRFFEVKSGTAVFDWTVPKEWRVRDAWIVTPDKRRICNFRENNLHLVGYSIPVHKRVTLKELNPYLHSLPNQPSAIPYVTSYYEERWGFCISQLEREKLIDGEYEVLIDSELFDGSLTYGELVVPGRSTKEVFLSTYVCHPSMANNEVSGVSVAAFIAKWLTERLNNRYTYRIVFVPETIGSITYLSFNKDKMKANVFAGFNVTCIGDERAYSYLPSRNGNTISDSVAKHILKHTDPDYIAYKWTDRGSDERQYCAPHIDLPIASIMRSKYGKYDEYHTSLDDLTHVVTPRGLEGGYNALKRAIEAIELNYYPRVEVLGEPQLGRRGLYPTLSTKTSGLEARVMMDLITWSDGTKSLLDIAELCDVPIWELYPIVDKLVEHDLMSLHDSVARSYTSRESELDLNQLSGESYASLNTFRAR
jgi:aminopeptidase-like protein